MQRGSGRLWRGNRWSLLAFGIIPEVCGTACMKLSAEGGVGVG